MEFCANGDHFLLRKAFHLSVTVQNAVYGLHGYLRSKLHQSVIDVLHIEIIFDFKRFLHDDAARINIMVKEECGHARLRLTVDDGPVDGRSTPILGQQGSMHIKRAEARHGPDHLGKHAESHHHLKVSLEGTQLFHKLGVLHFNRLQNGQSLCLGVQFHLRRLKRVLMTSHWLVGLRHHGHDMIATFHQTLKSAHGKLRRTHKNDA